MDDADGDFLELLNAVVDYQRAWNEPLSRFWSSRGFVGRAQSPSDVPPVATDVFRQIRLTSAERKPVATFRTSGTTSGARGEHHKLSLRAYDHGALKQARELVFWQRTPALDLFGHVAEGGTRLEPLAHARALRA